MESFTIIRQIYAKRVTEAAKRARGRRLTVILVRQANI